MDIYFDRIACALIGVRVEKWYDSLKIMKVCVYVSVFLPDTATLLMILFLFVQIVDEEPHNNLTEGIFDRLIKI